LLVGNHRTGAWPSPAAGDANPAWHLGDDYTQLTAARERLLKKGLSESEIKIAILDNGFARRQAGVPEHLDEDIYGDAMDWVQGTPVQNMTAPGGWGNAVFGGHRTTQTHPFLNTDQLKPGDQIDFVMQDGWNGLDLGRALERSYSTDAHFAAYRTPNGRRLTRDAIDLGVAVELTCTVFDVDCLGTHGTAIPAPESWRKELRQKVAALTELHPDPYFYETKGGARIVYAQQEPIVLRTHEDARRWSQRYAVSVAYLLRTVGIVADPSCADWQRLFRAPHATRSPGKGPENWAIFGDAARIGALVIEATEADVAAAKRSSTVFRKSRAVEHSSPGVGGDGLLYHALRLRGHVGAQAPCGGWYALCPNRSQHTVNTDWTDSTVVVPPDSGHEIGLILCRHGHCWERFTVKQWLRMFSDSELDQARAAAGITSRRAA